MVTPALTDRITADILLPVIHGLRARGIIYKGILYAGLMIQHGQAKVVEFNVRFGDPECQPLMLRLRSDLVDVMEAVLEERLADITLVWDARPAVCVVLAAGGYPGSYETGTPIFGLETLQDWKDGMVFHAGTAKSNDAVVTKGGRVLGVTAVGADISKAIAEAYRAVGKISWAGMHYRRDIGHRAFNR
jgi:phosphoribosylamine--glycine ligase